MSTTYRADAVLLTDRGLEDSTLLRTPFVDCSRVLGQLSELNRVQLAFYLYGVSAPPHRQRLLEFVIGHAEFDVVKDALNTAASVAGGTEPLIAEIMYVMEKFALMRKVMNTCKHAAERLYGTPKRISEFWRKLGTFCEACHDNEAREILQHFLPNAQFDRLVAETVVLLLHQNGILTDNDSSKLYEYVKDRYNSELVQTIRPASEERYPMVHSPHGRAVIINHNSFRDPGNVVKLDTRSGTAQDVDALRCLWEEFGFEVEVWQDKTGAEVKQSLAELGRLDHTNFDAFVLVVLSHGYKGGFYASDCERISLESVEGFLCDQNETLNGKPKVICVQACQINDSVEGMRSDALASLSLQPPPVDLQNTVVSSPDGVGTAQNRADMLKLMSTIPNYVSYRDPEMGSVFVREFVSAVRENWRTQDLLQMTLTINGRISSKAIPVQGERLQWDRQVSEVRSTLRKQLFLNKR